MIKKDKNLFYKVNEVIALRLEEGKTQIYIKEKKFLQCKQLVLNIPVDKVEKYAELDSIDEIAKYYKSTELTPSFTLTLEQEFWGHCSNLQVWEENGYDTRLLHSNLAFPLLKKLTKGGDLKAQRVFKEEIAKRFESGTSSVRKYLIREDYLCYLTKDELDIIFHSCLKNKDFIFSLGLLRLFSKAGVIPAHELFKKEIEKKIKSGNTWAITDLVQKGYIKYFSKDELDPFLPGVKDNTLKYILKNNTNFQHCYNLHINTEDYLITFDNMLGVKRLIDIKLETASYSHSISLATERDELKKVKYKDAVSYDFHIITLADSDEITEKVKVMLPYKYLWWAYRILHKSKDCRLFIPHYPLSKKIIIHHKKE